MLYLAISSPRPDQPSTLRSQQTAFWDWLRPLREQGTARHVYAKLGRGAVIVFDVDSPETMHKLLNQWTEFVPASFEVIPLIDGSHQEQIARAGTHPGQL